MPDTEQGGEVPPVSDPRAFGPREILIDGLVARWSVTASTDPDDAGWDLHIHNVFVRNDEGGPFLAGWVHPEGADFRWHTWDLIGDLHLGENAADLASAMDAVERRLREGGGPDTGAEDRHKKLGAPHGIQPEHFIEMLGACSRIGLDPGYMKRGAEPCVCLRVEGHTDQTLPGLVAEMLERGDAFEANPYQLAPYWKSAQLDVSGGQPRLFFPDLPCPPRLVRGDLSIPQFFGHPDAETAEEAFGGKR